MTKEEVKAYLKQAFRLDRRISINIEKVNAMKASLHGRATSYESDGSAHVPSGNSVESALMKVLAYEQRINKEIDMLVDKRLEIEKTIKAVPDARLREILTRRYLLYQKWDYIADEMHYNIKWLHKLHNRAITKLTIESDC